MKSNFGIEIINSDDLHAAAANGNLARYSQVLLTRAALVDLAAHAGTAAMLAGKALLVETSLSAPPLDEETLDWLFSHKGSARVLATFTDNDLEFAAIAGGSSRAGLAAWIKRRCAELQHATGLRVVFEHRLSAANAALTAAEACSFFATTLSDSPEVSLSIEIDALLQARVATDLAVNQIVSRDFARRCAMVSIQTPFPQSKFYERLGLELSNYPREIWALMADLVRTLNAATIAPTGVEFQLNVRRGLADESSNEVVRWADVIFKTL